MKQLIVLRHGKAEERSPEGDFGRRLTERGRRDAASAGKRIRGMAATVDVIVASDAVRALETARIVTRELGAETALMTNHRLYGASVHGLMEIACGLDDHAKAAVIVGHNPGLEELVLALCPETGDDFRLSPASFAILEFDISSWRDLRVAIGGGVRVFHPG
jgi:phosphohistidine phosphatase